MKLIITFYYAINKLDPGKAINLIELNLSPTQNID